jgi:NADH-quinone oxidoreductase subunit L
LPTPVSALLHAATLVAGGTYLLLRCSAIISASTDALLLAATIGTITAILAASTALFQSDAKRIIAYSTMSVRRCVFLMSSLIKSQMYFLNVHQSPNLGIR